MSPEEINVTIAEACGWRFFYSKHNHWIVDSPSGDRYSPGFGVWTPFNDETGKKNPPLPKWYGCYDIIPDYLNDLNAMHEAVWARRKDRDFVQEYSNQLRKSVGGAEWATFAIENATAAQRAEAFLRAIGAWEEAK